MLIGMPLFETVSAGSKIYLRFYEIGSRINIFILHDW